MYRLAWRGPSLVLAGLLLVFGGKVFAASSPTPTLFTVNAAKPQLTLQGARKAWPIKFSEATAMTAVFQGGMWLPNPEGGRIYAKYQRHILHTNGTWTWIGTVATVQGDQSVVLTFSQGAMFGYIPQASGWPLEITTRDGQTSIVATDGKALEGSAQWLHTHSQPDYVIPPRQTVPAAAGKTPAAASRPMATAAAPVTITVMVAYTPGFVTAYGSASAAVARIQFLVDWTNQAYVNSKVYQQLALVNTVQVNYTDSNSNENALYDLTGSDSNGNAVTPVPTLYSTIAPLRKQYAADLVSLIRPLDAAAAGASTGECGIGWLNGAGGNALAPAYGFSVVSDIADSTVTGGQSCLTGTFAHELGHNMGNAHDRGTANGSGEGASPAGGAYTYSYGYVNSSLGFSTIMAYGTAGETPMQVFSNPDINFCKNSPCGVADSSPNSADNAHSMNNTAPIIAQFAPGAAGPGSWNYSYYYYPRNDVVGMGTSNLLWMNTGSSTFGLWEMSGAHVVGISTSAVAPGYRVVATGDFNGDGKVDVVWQGPANDLYLWTSTGTGFTSRSIGTLPAGSQIVGAGDVCDCDPADLIFVDPTSNIVGYRAMNGATTNQLWSTTVAPGYRIAAMGDFFGDGKTDLIWTSANNDLYMWVPNGKGNGFNGYSLGTYPAGWTLVGAGDVNGDGKDDLLWRNQGAGLFGYWIMNGASEVSGATFPAASSYSIAATGDFNGDGAIDIMWTSAANDLYLWSSTGADASFTPSYVGTYPAGWSVIPSQLMAAFRHAPQ